MNVAKLISLSQAPDWMRENGIPPVTRQSLHQAAQEGRIKTVRTLASKKSRPLVLTDEAELRRFARESAKARQAD